MNQAVEYVCNKAQRLDIFLADMLKESRSQVSQLIDKNCVYVDDNVVGKSGFKLKDNQIVRVVFPKQEQKESQEIDFTVEIIYEDDDLLVINKPSSLTVHPAPSVKEHTLVDWLKYKGIKLSTLSGDERHGIVHRLDKGTSGAMVIAKNNAAHQFLSTQLKDKSMGRYYICVINPPLKNDIITVEKKIARSTHNRLKMSCDDKEGRDSKSIFSALALSKDEKNQLIACKLFTGRTHQIRVHLESLNRHILGDNIYAASLKSPKSERILLHAYMIYFVHPRTKETLFFVAELDSYMKNFLLDKFDRERLNEILETDYIKHSFSVCN